MLAKSPETKIEIFCLELCKKAAFLDSFARFIAGSRPEAEGRTPLMQVIYPKMRRYF